MKSGGIKQMLAPESSRPNAATGSARIRPTIPKRFNIIGMTHENRPDFACVNRQRRVDNSLSAN